jgi:pectate lyase
MCNGGTCAAVEPLVGYAAVEGLGRATTTGGGTAGVVRPANADELLAYASDATPRVIELTGTFNVPRLNVGSNKTIVGVGGATINGGIRILGTAGVFVQNVILRDFKLNAATSQGLDGIEISYAHHVWIDHLEIWDAADGNLDMVHGSDYVTISWCKFWYSATPPDDNHRYANMVGHSDSNGPEDQGALKVTFHHNWWAERVADRMPRVRFGKVHLFNNYYSSAGNTNGINAAFEGSVLVEYNVFNGIRNPHYFNNANDQLSAYITARGNLHTATTGKMETGGGGTALTVPYSYTTDAATNVQQRVTQGAGPR